MRGLVSRLGLRQRVSAAFGLGAFLVAVFVAVTTYTIAANYLWAQRESTTLRQASFNARAVDAALAADQPSLDELLERIDSLGQTSSPLIRWRGSWYADRFRPGIRVLPETFLAAAESGESVQEQIDLPTGEVVAIAIPLEGGSYVEVFPLDELNQTLTTLAVTFAGTTTVATALGVLVGRWASRRALRPLATVTAAAGAIAGGDLGARIGVQRDADLNSLAEAFDDTATKLEARVERDARFAADVSHELRSPLTTMVNAVDLLLDRLEEMRPETQEILLLLSDDVHRFAEMVKDLLELALLDTAAIPLVEQEFAVTELVSSVADRLAGRAVTRVSLGDDPVVTLDPRRLERIVENLVRNAETHGNGVTGVWVESKGDVVRLIVEDHGPGVPEEARERIFDRFAKGSTSARSSGVGLGLSLVSEHVRMNGGRVWVEDGPQGGARFVVELPAYPEASGRHPASH